MNNEYDYDENKDEFENDDFENEIQDEDVTRDGLLSIIVEVKNHLLSKSDFSKNFIFLSVIGISIIALGASFFGHLINSFKLLEYFPSNETSFFLQQWGSAFSVWHMKIWSVIAIPAVFILSYFYLSYLEKMMNPSFKKTEEAHFFEKLQIHLFPFITVPVLIFSSFAYAFAIRLLGYPLKLQLVSLLPQFFLTWFAFSIILKSYLMHQKSWMKSLIAATVGAIIFEFTKHAGIGIFFWSSKAPILANLFTLTILSIVINSAIAWVYVYGGYLGYVLVGGDVLKRDRFGEIHSGGFRAMREIGIIALVEITRGLLKNNNVGLDARELAEVASITDVRAQQVLNHLETVGLVRQMKNRDGQLVSILTYSPEKISIKSILDSIEQRGKLKIGDIDYTKWFWKEYYQALDNKFCDISLRDLAEGEIAPPVAA